MGYTHPKPPKPPDPPTAYARKLERARNAKWTGRRSLTGVERPPPPPKPKKKKKVDPTPAFKSRMDKIKRLSDLKHTTQQFWAEKGVKSAAVGRSKRFSEQERPGGEIPTRVFLEPPGGFESEWAF